MNSRIRRPFIYFLLILIMLLLAPFGRSAAISQVIVSNFSIYIFYYLHHWVPQMKSKTLYNLVFFTFTYISTDFTGLHQTVKIRQRWSNLLRIDQEQTTKHQQCFTISALFKQKLIPVWIHPYGTCILLWHINIILEFILKNKIQPTWRRLCQ